MKSEYKSTTLPLKGLEADNLLAFLALLGLLRALEVAEPDAEPRIAWSGKPPVAVLDLAVAVSAQDAITQIDAGLRTLGQSYALNKNDLRYTADEFRELAQGAQGQRERAQLIAALASDGALKRRNKEREVEVTPLCAMFVQGHQHFLSRLTAIAQRDNPNDQGDLARALFEPWCYDDDAPGFRWDPMEDRRYAHQFGNPSEDRNKVGTVPGANRLAAIGFCMLTSAPTASGLATLGVFGGRRERNICWPLVAVPASLSGYMALLAHPWLGDEEMAPGLATYGVVAIARSRRYQVEKFFNFERARLQFL
jgi:hypothetical protein